MTEYDKLLLAASTIEEMTRSRFTPCAMGGFCLDSSRDALLRVNMELDNNYKEQTARIRFTASLRNHPAPMTATALRRMLREMRDTCEALATLEQMEIRVTQEQLHDFDRLVRSRALVRSFTPRTQRLVRQPLA